MELTSIKNIELDKICRVCLATKKDMRPLFGEMIADMLMECARVQIDNTDGWPDKICIQCVHQVSRCHAFKTRVERSDQELRNYIKGLTVIVEEPITQIELQRSELSSNHHQIQQHNRNQEIHLKSEIQHQARQELHRQVQAQTQDMPQQIVIPNGQLHNAQILNAAQIVTTHNGQQVAQLVNAGQIGQLIQTGNTVQMIQQNGQPAQVVQIQRTADDRCEIIVQPDLQGETQYFEDVTVEQAVHGEQVEHTEDVIHLHEEEEIEEEDEEEMTEEFTFTLEVSDDTSDTDDKMYLAEFISLQTSCPSPGRYICNLCRKEFKHSRWLQTHMKSHSNWIKANCKRQPQCEICHRSFKGPGMLKMHMKTHEQKTADKIPTCNICHKEFKSKTILYRHRQVHQAKTYQCGNCLRSFASPYTLTSHMNTKHSSEDQKFRCAQCEDIFSTIEELKAHVQALGHSGKLSKKSD